MEISNDYLLKAIGLKEVIKMIFEEENMELKKENIKLKKELEELQKLLKQKVEDV